MSSMPVHPAPATGRGTLVADGAESLLDAVLRRRHDATTPSQDQPDAVVVALPVRETADGLPRRRRNQDVAAEFSPLQPDASELPWLQTRRRSRRRWAGAR